MPRPRSWTDEQLIAAVAASRTLSEVCRRLGIQPGKYDVLRAHIRRLGVDASHLPRASRGLAADCPPLPGRGPRRGSKGRDHRARCTPPARLLAERRNVPRRGRAHPRARARHQPLPRSGVGRRASTSTGRTRPLTELLVEDRRSGRVPCGSSSSPPASSRLTARSAVSPSGAAVPCHSSSTQCYPPGLLRRPFVHINGDHTDNRLENLRILCPNCHALTDTWCGRNEAGVSQRQRRGT